MNLKQMIRICHGGQWVLETMQLSHALPPPGSILARASAWGAGGRGSIPRPRHTKDVKNGRFALLSMALGINELGNQLGDSESV